MTDETANSRSAKEAGAAGATGDTSAPVTDAPQPRPERTGPADATATDTPTASAGTTRNATGGTALRPGQEQPDTAPDTPDEPPAATGKATGTTVLRPGAPLPGAAEGGSGADAEPDAEADAGSGTDGGAATEETADTGAPEADAAAPAPAAPAAGKKASAGRRGLGLFRRMDAAVGAAAGAAGGTGAETRAESGSRVSPGVVAGAALAGVVLLGAPFAISALSKTFAASPTNAAGDLTQPLPDAGSDGGRGFVPVPGGVRDDGGTAPRTDSHAPADSGNAPGDGSGGGSGTGPHTDGDATTRTDPTAGSADHGDKAATDDKGSGSDAHARTLATRTFTAFAGPTCANTANAGYHEIGAYGDGKEGWLTRTGGSTAGGCGGGSRAIPMSGDADSPDSDVTAYWQFNSGMKSASCRISVYIPQGKSPVEVGGAPARYSVHKGTKWYGGDLAGFHIDQPRNKGSWVLGTTVHVEGGRFTLRVTNAGQDWKGDTSTLAHVAAAQVKAECRAE
ncbi:hypothetical protein [Streptomyces catenulae]|uniref:Translation initiation factor IF-2 n=1 Tax=Streptomyces catenulae TaxID=66875 RepID=A0ABV2Z012_9ACTN|nr:hypothetical protein [Streptomyces catenulae]